ncbi:YrhB domain-containing protein [Kitasatospora sp. NPDC101447]|uniref:YrhB domain-containing protein n=1 Tax=Kitasatospora sp. NPDC101447 TaxID=3364102 RepID=UPI00381B989A
MISEERAVELVESQLAREQLTWAGPVTEWAVYHVEEHAVGWLVFWNTAEYARTRDLLHNAAGAGPYLVDRQDGSIHHIPTTTWMAEDWEKLYLRQIKGIRPADPLASSVRGLVRSAGLVAAMSHLRKQAPRLSLQEAKAFVMAVRDGAEPPDELVRRAQAEEQYPQLDIETLAGPAQ